MTTLRDQYSEKRGKTPSLKADKEKGQWQESKGKREVKAAALVYRICQFPKHKYSHCGQFRAPAQHCQDKANSKKGGAGRGQISLGHRDSCNRFSIKYKLIDSFSSWFYKWFSTNEVLKEASISGPISPNKRLWTSSPIAWELSSFRTPCLYETTNQMNFAEAYCFNKFANL